MNNILLKLKQNVKILTILKTNEKGNGMMGNNVDSEKDIIESGEELVVLEEKKLKLFCLM